MNPAYINCRGYHGIILFLFLVARAMVAMSTGVVILVLFTLLLLSRLQALPVGQTGYLAVALTVCKNE